MKRILIVLLLTGCATFDPRIGMTYDQFRSAFRTSHNAATSELQLVVAEADARVYRIADVFYYFEGDVLQRIDQGQLYEQRVAVSVSQGE